MDYANRRNTYEIMCILEIQIGRLAFYNSDGEHALISGATPRAPTGRCKVAAAGSMQRVEV
jgi:hypothetical protein